MKLTHLPVLAAILLIASCARPAYEQRGFASYIADQYAGRHTSSGELYSPYNWTAAHNTLPFGTQVKVKNNFNGRSVNVTINDRFPFYPGRVINVSRAAAEYLQIPPNMMADVTVTARSIPGGMAPVPQAGYNAAPPPGYGATPPPTGQQLQAPPASSTPPPNLPPPPPGYGTLPPAQ